MSEEETMQHLVNFYLSDGPEWKTLYMRGKISDYRNDFDKFILDITLFYYHIHPWQQNWQIDILNKNISTDNIIRKLNNYLMIYKRKYLGFNFTENNPVFDNENHLIIEIKKNLDYLSSMINKIDKNANNSKLNQHIQNINDELNIVDGILRKQQILSHLSTDSSIPSLPSLQLE